MRFLAFVRLYRGRLVQAPGGLGGQCVDLINVYLLDVWSKPEIHANAVDWAQRTIQGMTWEPNGPANHPPTGAIVVWRQYAPSGIGINGHIAVCIAADAMDLVTFDQNWPEGSSCQFVLHDYGGVVGWFRPAG